jgi:hypothetical protein
MWPVPEDDKFTRWKWTEGEEEFHWKDPQAAESGKWGSCFEDWNLNGASDTQSKVGRSQLENCKRLHRLGLVNTWGRGPEQCWAKVDNTTLPELWKELIKDFWLHMRRDKKVNSIYLGKNCQKTHVLAYGVNFTFRVFTMVTSTELGFWERWLSQGVVIQ